MCICDGHISVRTFQPSVQSSVQCAPSSAPCNLHHLLLVHAAPSQSSLLVRELPHGAEIWIMSVLCRPCRGGRRGWQSQSTSQFTACFDKCRISSSLKDPPSCSGSLENAHLTQMIKQFLEQLAGFEMRPSSLQMLSEVLLQEGFPIIPGGSECL